MKQSLRIAIAEDEPELLANLEEMLTDIGHEVVAAVETGEALVSAVRELSPQLVITDIKMPDMTGLDAAGEIRQFRPTPFVLVSAYHDKEFVDRALREQVLAYLIKPVQEETLKASICLAMQRFREFQALHAQAANLEQALEERKIVERAKGILMKRAGLNETDAFRRLQLLSSQKNKTIIEIARTLVEADQAMES